MALSRRPSIRLPSFKPSITFPHNKFRREAFAIRSKRGNPCLSRSRGLAVSNCSSSEPLKLEEVFEPKHGLPIIRERVTFGQLLQDIRSRKVKEIRWLSHKNETTFEGTCLVEYNDGLLKQSTIPHDDITIPTAMTANGVKGSILSPVPSESELNPVSPISEQMLNVVAKVFPVVSLIGVYIAVQYMNWLKGDYGDRLKMKKKEKEDERKQADEITDESLKSEAETLAEMGMGVKEIVDRLREAKIDFELYRIKQLVDRAQLKAKEAEEENKLQKSEKQKERSESDAEKKTKDGSPEIRSPRTLSLGDDSDDQAYKMLTLNTLQVLKPRRKERDVYEEEEAQRKMKQLTRKMRSRGMKLQYTDDDRVYFDDVAGVGNAKFEVMEVVDFFINSSRFRQSGARIPRGVLLCGPPGCGKTMLARAVAGEAGVSFLCVNASEFVEMFVGVGASRVRDLFAEARNNAPCIVFIDEIDAVGRVRGGAMGNDERDQTVNQLLSEMDGFNRQDADVIVMAATNRRDVLDLALIRAGRFDRIVNVSLPDLEGRIEILETYLNRVDLEEEIKVRDIAFETQRFSGAALANLVNTACIFAGRAGRSGLCHGDLVKALDYEKLGPSRPAYSDGRQKRLAVHEASTALVAYLMPSIEPIVYVTIVPREKHPMGQTVLRVDGNRELTQQFTQRYLSEQLLMILASRAGEEIIYGQEEMSTINQRKIAMARRIVQKLLVTDNLETIEGIGHRLIFAPRQIDRIKKQIGVPWGTSYAHEIVDTAMEKRLNNAYEESKQILQRNKKALDVLIPMLTKENILTGDQVSKVVKDFGNAEDIQKRNAERCDFM